MATFLSNARGTVEQNRLQQREVKHWFVVIGATAGLTATVGFDCRCQRTQSRPQRLFACSMLASQATRATVLLSKLRPNLFHDTLQ